VHSVAYIGDDRKCGVDDADPHLPGNADVLSIKSAGHQQDRHFDFTEALPVRRLGALPHAAQTVGQSHGLVAEPNIALRTGNPIGECTLAFPDRELLPLIDERLNASVFDPPRHDLIRFHSLVSFVLILNTRGGAH